MSWSFWVARSLRSVGQFCVKIWNPCGIFGLRPYSACQKGHFGNHIYSSLCVCSLALSNQSSHMIWTETRNLSFCWLLLLWLFFLTVFLLLIGLITFLATALSLFLSLLSTVMAISVKFRTVISGSGVVGALWWSLAARRELVKWNYLGSLGDRLLVLEPSLYKCFDLFDWCIGFPCGWELVFYLYR